MSVSANELSKFEQACEEKDKRLFLRDAPFWSVFFDHQAHASVPRHRPVPQNQSNLKAVSQGSSGRCWIFAGLNVLRHASQDKIPRLELSGAYLMFYDKLEKANLFLKHMWILKGQPVESRIVEHLLGTPISDGGQFGMLADLLDKYGCVPLESMPDSYHAANTQELNKVLNDMLRYYANMIRMSKEQGPIREEALANVYKTLTMALGVPPRHVQTDHNVPKLSPQEFFKSLRPVNFCDQVVLISVPQQNRPFNSTFEVQFLGSRSDGKPIRYLNVPMQVMKEAVAHTLDQGQRVWFGSDVGKCFHKFHGILDPAVFRYDQVIGIDTTLPKSERLRFHQSKVSHAMVFAGYHKSPQNYLSWSVENSWGPTHKEGYLDMSDEWFSEYVVEAVVDRNSLTPELVSIWDHMPATPLPAWDPLGNLLD